MTTPLSLTILAAHQRLREYAETIEKSEVRGDPNPPQEVVDELAEIRQELAALERIAEDHDGLHLTPHAAMFYSHDLGYFRGICERTQLSTRKLAARIGIDDGELRGYLSGRRGWPYVVQFAIEQLAVE